MRGKQDRTMNAGAYWRDIAGRVRQIKTVREEVEQRSGPLGHAANWIGRVLSHPAFFLGLLVGHLGWAAANLPWAPWPIWDPYPFTLLATIASVEAPFIALLVLMHQRRTARIDELREEVLLQMVMHQDRQASMLLQVAHQLATERDLPIADSELLSHLEEEISPEALVEALRDRLTAEDSGPI